jgi:hypothetical protein
LPEGVSSVFSAGPRHTALDRPSNDDANPNSVFTRTFAKELLQPGENTIVLHCAPNTPHATYALQVTVAGAQNQQTQTFALEIRPLLLAP